MDPIEVIDRVERYQKQRSVRSCMCAILREKRSKRDAREKMKMAMDGQRDRREVQWVFSFTLGSGIGAAATRNKKFTEGESVNKISYSSSLSTLVSVCCSIFIFQRWSKRRVHNTRIATPLPLTLCCVVVFDRGWKCSLNYKSKSFFFFGEYTGSDFSINIHHFVI